ncbi:hypothetical protein STENM327S_04455 [Streptomyces tendae]
MAPQPSAPPADRSARPAAARPTDRRRAWPATAMIVTFMVINFADKSVLGLAAVPIMDELHISNSTYGLISSSFYLLFSLSGLVVGFFSSRISSRTMLFVMALLWAVAQLPVLALAAVPTLIAGRVLLGVTEGPAASMSMHALYKWFPPSGAGCPRPCRSAAPRSARWSPRPCSPGSSRISDGGRHTPSWPSSACCGRWCGGGRATTDRTTRHVRHGPVTYGR